MEEADEATQRSGHGRGDDQFTEEELHVPAVKYEYLDHTADVQIHAWGDTLEEAFEQVAVGMYAYMTEIDRVDITMDMDIEAEGDDLQSLLFQFLNECLYVFCVEPYFIARKVKVTELDKENFRIKAKGYGEPFVLGKHPQGTEVKAITYSCMQVLDEADRHEIFVIIDI